MSFWSSVIPEWQIGRTIKNNFRAWDARIVVFLATLSSGVHSRTIFTCRKGMCYVSEDHTDHGGRNRKLNSRQMRKESSESILVFFPCRLVPTFNTKLKIDSFGFLDTIFFEKLWRTLVVVLFMKHIFSRLTEIKQFADQLGTPTKPRWPALINDTQVLHLFLIFNLQWVWRHRAV